MAPTPDAKTKLKRSSGRMLARLIRFVERTSRIETHPPNLQDRLRASHPLIMACWHGQFMMLSHLNPGGVSVKAMVARHGDAELIGAAMETFGLELIRGAGAGGRRKDRGGAYALRAAVSTLKDNASVVMTADVPPGPARRAGEGIIQIARLSGCPIYPVAAASSRYKAFRTWSRMTINLPFSKLVFVGADPIFVPLGADADACETYRMRLQTDLRRITNEAYVLAGADPARATPPDSVRKPATAGLRFRMYRNATKALRPVAPMLLSLRVRQGKEDARRLGERYGIATAARPDGKVCWIHAASVGETNAMLPLMNALLDRRPELSFVVTTGTMTSAALADERLPARALHQFVPLDHPKYARRFLDHWQPDLALFTESEIWPNLIMETSRGNTPLALVNARMSDRSFRRWKKNAKMAAGIFGQFDVILAQNEKFAKWFTKLGGRRVLVTGNLKIDSPPPPVDADALDAMQTAIGARDVLLAASTHDGEDGVILDAHAQLQKTRPNRQLAIMIPRHPERGGDVAALAAARGLNVTLRSSGALPDAVCDVYVADTLGELGTFFQLADMAFIGGSLVNKGGQNPIEAIRSHVVPIVGPHRQNFRDAYDTLLRHDAACTIETATDLANLIAHLRDHPATLAQLRNGGADALLSLAGALAQSADLIEPLLAGTEALKRAS